MRIRRRTRSSRQDGHRRDPGVSRHRLSSSRICRSPRSAIACPSFPSRCSYLPMPTRVEGAGPGGHHDFRLRASSPMPHPWSGRTRAAPRMSMPWRASPIWRSRSTGWKPWTAVRSVSLVVSWFGDDLRAGHCRIRPKVEIPQKTTIPAWSVSRVTRDVAQVVSRDDQGRPVYGGAPADFSVIEAIRAIRARGHRVTFYPFLMMDIPVNPIPCPIRIRTMPPPSASRCCPGAGGSLAHRRRALPDRKTEPQRCRSGRAFFGGAQPSDFAISGETVTWTRTGE